MPSRLFTMIFCCLCALPVRADVGDPQIGTDDLWYPGELSCSTFARLQATQAKLYESVVGIKPTTEEQKVLAAWLWRNTHYWHGEEGAEDLWGKGFVGGADLRTREYWTGLFADGFGLCGTTHGQWVAEMEALLGHNRGRCVGVDGHNSFEVFLKGGVYGDGKWVLLDHDISTVIYNPQGTALLSIPEIRADWKRLTDRKFSPEKQHGWLVCGLYPGDGGVYRQYGVAEYLAGYSGPPPMVHLRRGETLRRYPQPGLEDGKTFVFWGRNYHPNGIPGPERAETWVNQPDKMYNSRTGTGNKTGQARFGNAVYVYKPDFTTTDYREGIVAGDEQHLDFEFGTPYIIAATPANAKPWGVYDPGCRNGLVLHGKADCAVALSIDRGRTWKECGKFVDGMDLTDLVKGRRQYLLRLQTGADALRKSGLTITTVCQGNTSVMPRLKDNGSAVRFAASNQAVVSAGPNLEQAKTHIVAGQFGTPKVTMALAAPRGAKVAAIYAAAHVLSSSPPRAEVKYQIELSVDEGKTWKPLVKDWSITRRGDEPKDFWSQSLCWGSQALDSATAAAIQVRFRNDGGKKYARCEVHLVYRTAGKDATKVTFAWADDHGPHTEAHTFAPGAEPWRAPTGKNVKTRWVEMEPAATR